MPEMLTIIGADLRSIRNIFAKKIDKLTRIEIIAFIIFLGAFVLHRVYIALYWQINYQSVQAATASFWHLSQLYFIALFAEGIFTARFFLSRTQNRFLLINPITPNQFFTANFILQFLNLFPFFLLWMGALGIFSYSVHLSVQQFFLELLVFTGAFLLCWLASFAVALYLLHWKKISILIITAATVFMFELFIIYLPDISKKIIPTIFIVLIFSTMLSSWLTQIFKKLLQANPHIFFRMSKRRKSTQHPLTNLFLLAIPKTLKALVKKDLQFAGRQYTGFFPAFYFIIFMMAAGLINQDSAKDAAGWFTFVCLFAAYALALMGFKFMEPTAENLEILKIHAVSGAKLWAAKFMKSFAIFQSVYLFGLILYLLRHHTLSYILPATAIALWGAFTILAIQTNFALQSWPFMRSAMLWFHIFLFTGILFFTVFLFPPLTVALLLLGYAGIYWSIKRINNLDLSNDNY